MPLDSNRVYRPDFQADSKLPSWIPMGDEGSKGMGGSFVDALKQRMAQPKTPDVKLPPPDVPMPNDPAPPEAQLPDFGPRAPIAGAAATRPRTTGGMGGGGGSL